MRRLFPSVPSVEQASTTNTQMDMALSSSRMFHTYAAPSFDGLFGGTPAGNRSAPRSVPHPPGSSTVSRFYDEDVEGRFSVFFK